VQDSAVNRPTHPIPAPPVGNHLISDTAKHRLQGHKATFGRFRRPGRGAVLGLSAYATKMGRSLVPAYYRAHRKRRRIGRPAADPGAQHVPFVAFGSISPSISAVFPAASVCSAPGTASFGVREPAGTTLDRIEAPNPTFNHHRAEEPRHPPDVGVAAQSEFANLRSGPERPSVTSAPGSIKVHSRDHYAREGGHASFGVHSTPRLVGRRDSGRGSLA
jgi:hypothetical protein